MCYSYVIPIPNGFFICKRGLMFDLIGFGESVIVNCSRFDYISNKIVAMEAYDKIHIYSLEIIEICGKKVMKEIAIFKIYDKADRFYFCFNKENFFVTKDCKLHLAH